MKDRSAGYLANHMARVFARGLAERIRPIGLSTGTFPVLLELWETDGLSQKQLVERLEIEQATIANTLIRMERDGLIIRAKDPNDARSQRILLTDRARALRNPAIAAAQAENAAALAAFTYEEHILFLDLMQKVIATRRSGRDRDPRAPD